MLLAALIAPGAFATDDLWNRAVARFGGGDIWIPGLVITTSEEYDGRDNLRHIEQTVSRTRINSSGDIETEIISAIRDGEDITAQRQSGEGPSPFGGFGPNGDEAAAAEAEDGADRFAAAFTSIFDPAEQQRLTVQRIGPQVVEGQRTIAYRFDHQPNPRSRATGTAWLHRETGAPVRIEKDVAPPLAVITDFQIVQVFGNPDEEFQLTDMTVDVSGSLLVVRRRFVIDLTFEEYFRGSLAQPD